MNKLQIFEQKNYTCEKCGYRDRTGEKISLYKDHILCHICKTFAPEDEQQLKIYIEDKIDSHVLEAFRKYYLSKPQATKQGMEQVHKQGLQISRAPFGYNMIQGQLHPDENKKHLVREIYKDFLENKSLNKIAKSQGLTVNGVKKILKNHAYVGKVKFSGILTQGKHLPILDYKLFNDVQRKIEDMNKKQQMVLNN